MPGFYHHPTPGLLRIAGEHRRDFLQRQTSNDLRPLAPGRAIQTVLTSPTARILDVLTLIEAGENLLAITLPGRAEATARFLKSRIFFMDRVTVADESAAWQQVDVFDPDSAIKLVGTIPAAGDVAKTEWGYVIGNGGLTDDGWRLLFPAEMAVLIPGGVVLTPQAYAAHQVECGHPSPAAELTEAYTPLETGLQALVSENKGCFTGQEVLARQVNYDKVTRHLAGIRLQAPVDVGTPVTVDGKAAGEITSSAVSPRFGAVALAVLRRPHHEPGTAVMVGDAPGVVVALPFSL
jgi:folate-binding protein YgfZ